MASTGAGRAYGKARSVSATGFIPRYDIITKNLRKLLIPKNFFGLSALISSDLFSAQIENV